VISNPYAAEYGQFTGAVTTVQTKSGSDKFNVDAESVFPRFRRRAGSFVGIAAFTPRVTFSGPLIKDKLKFMQSFEYDSYERPVENLPPLKRDTGLESFDSVSQLDWERYRPEPPLDYVFLVSAEATIRALEYVQSAGGKHPISSSEDFFGP